MSKSKNVAKSTKKSTPKKTLTPFQELAQSCKLTSKQARSLAAQYAAMKAHLTDTFQNERTRDDKKEQAQAYRDYVKSAPRFVRERFADDIKDVIALLRKSNIIPAVTAE